MSGDHGSSALPSALPSGVQLLSRGRLIGSDIVAVAGSTTQQSYEPELY